MINHLSQSSIDQFLRCSWQWKLQRVDKLPTGTSWQMLAGGIVHEVAAWNFLHKVERKIDMPKAQLLEHAKKISRRKIDEVPRWHTKDLDEDLERMRTRVEVCTGLFADSVAPFIQPIEGGIEKKLKIPAGQGFPDILCFLDCIDGNNVIHDFKTTNKAPGVNYVSCEVHHEIQPSAYALAYRLAFGRRTARASTCRRRRAGGAARITVTLRQKTNVNFTSDITRFRLTWHGLWGIFPA